MAAIGLHHVLAMYAGAVAVPLIIGGAMKLSAADLAYLITADLLVCGIATLIRCVGFWRFGVRLPIMRGCTFAAVSPMVLIGTTGGGLPAIYGSVIVAGLAIALLAPVFVIRARVPEPDHGADRHGRGAGGRSGVRVHRLRRGRGRRLGRHQHAFP